MLTVGMLTVDVSEVKLLVAGKQNNLPRKCGQPIDGGERHQPVYCGPKPVYSGEGPMYSCASIKKPINNYKNVHNSCSYAPSTHGHGNAQPVCFSVD
jgi:hypothetical protein